MMLFKHKQKRSEWYKGLLYAEELYQTGYTIEDQGVQEVSSFLPSIYWLKITKEGCPITTRFGGVRAMLENDYTDGMLSYLSHYENNLKNIENNQ